MGERQGIGANLCFPGSDLNFLVSALVVHYSIWRKKAAHIIVREQSKEQSSFMFLPGQKNDCVTLFKRLVAEQHKLYGISAKKREK